MTLLGGLRVIEISSHGAAAQAGKYFADWGAEVIHLEPAAGTPLRGTPPYFTARGHRVSATWEWLSRGKTVARCGPGTEMTFDAARAACAEADVVFAESEAIGEVLGLAPGEVEAQFGGETIFTLISPFAVDGPYAGWRATDLGLMAKGGWMSLLGEPAREPLRPGGELLWRVTGMYAALGALIGLRRREQTGEREFIHISEQSVAPSLIVAPWLVRELTGVELARRGNFFPMSAMPCKDGWVGCAPLTEAHWELMCHWMGIADVLDLPGARDPQYRVLHGPELLERVKPWLMEHARMEIVAMAQQWRLPSAPVQDVAERLADAQLAARGFWRHLDVAGRTVRVPRVPYRLSAAEPVERGPVIERAVIEPRPATAPGATNGTRAAGGPLSGLRVLDLTWFWSGPSSTMLMGALGADVIKIESIQRPDPYRYTWAPTAAERFYEKGPLWHDCNANKRDLALDLSDPRGMEVFETLVRDADVVVSNFSNRVLPNLGLTVERFRELNPRLIVITAPGYGLGGPWEDWIGYGVAFEQMAVCASITGYADGQPIIMGGFCDPVVGLHCVIGLLLALRVQDETGKGSTVEVPQCETLDSIFAPEQIAVQMGAPVPGRMGNKHAWMAPHDAYRVAGDDQWLTLAVGSDREFGNLCDAIGMPGLSRDGRFATVEARKRNEAALDEALRPQLAHRDGGELERELQRRGVAALRVALGNRLTEEPGLLHLDAFEGVVRAASGTYHQKRYPWRFSGIELGVQRPPPTLGEHNREVLRDAGLDDAKIEELGAAGVIGTVPVGFAG